MQRDDRLLLDIERKLAELEPVVASLREAKRQLLTLMGPRSTVVTEHDAPRVATVSPIRPTGAETMIGVLTQVLAESGPCTVVEAVEKLRALGRDVDRGNVNAALSRSARKGGPIESVRRGVYQLRRPASEKERVAG